MMIFWQQCFKLCLMQIIFIIIYLIFFLLLHFSDIFVNLQKIPQIVKNVCTFEMAAHLGKNTKH